GEVIGEAKGPGIEPYLGLRYPAWDIPTQVRQIMLRAPFRVIKDIHAEHSALIQHPDACPLDMTLSHLRGVSPIYVEYLTNMGVRATMNISLIVHGQLWGMFAFHHYRPRHLTPDERSICELFGQLVSMMLQKEIEQSKLNRRQKSQSTLVALKDDGNGLGPVIAEMSHALMEITESDGLCLFYEGEYRNYGLTPSTDLTSRLVDYSPDEIIAIESLQSLSGISTSDIELGPTAGALIVRLQDDATLFFFRNEVVHSIRWAGGTEKELTHGPNGPRLSPRGSFAEYKESVSGRCAPWKEEDIAAASNVCRRLWKAMQVDTREQSKALERQKQYQDLLIAELNHRVRNTLALVRSIARQTKASSGSLEQYVELLESRIAALSAAHDLVGGNGLQWAQVHDLLMAELKPFQVSRSNVEIDGPNLSVRADMAPILALLFHELVSNSVKHGALSIRGRQLKVHWYDDADGISIDWVETLEAEVQEPDTRGFGLALIERALPYECNGRSKILFQGNQLKIQFWLPADAINRSNEPSPSAKEKPVRSMATPLDLSDEIASALIVEDNLVLAMEVEQLLLELGVESVETVPNLELAKSAIDRTTYDCAVMDINLGSETSFDITTRLRGTETRVVLASGYDSKFDLPESLWDIPRIVKPINKVDLFDAISRASKAD
ncbi:MAG: HWE histidine kinase domain-containing protein, partial [Planctomycetota bacterium]